jgi:hypothetical protein
VEEVEIKGGGEAKGREEGTEHGRKGKRPRPSRAQPNRLARTSLARVTPVRAALLGSVPSRDWRPTHTTRGGWGSHDAARWGRAVAGRGRWLLCFRESSRAPGAGEEPNPARCAVLVVSAATWMNRVSFAFHDQSSPGPARTARDDRRLRCGAALVDGREGGWTLEEGTREGGAASFSNSKNPVEGAELPVGLLRCLLR